VASTMAAQMMHAPRLLSAVLVAMDKRKKPATFRGGLLYDTGILPFQRTSFYTTERCRVKTRRSHDI
jgi:hypothetical protein